MWVVSPSVWSGVMCHGRCMCVRRRRVTSWYFNAFECLAVSEGVHKSPVNNQHKRPVMQISAVHCIVRSVVAVEASVVASFKNYTHGKDNFVFCYLSKATSFLYSSCLNESHMHAPFAEDISGLILGLRPANERHRHKVTPSLIGWAQTKNQPCVLVAAVGVVVGALAGDSLCPWKNIFRPVYYIATENFNW